MSTKIIGILIIIIGLGGLFGAAYYVYREMYYVPDEPVVLIDQTEEEEIEVEKEETIIPKNNLLNIPVKTEEGSTEKILERQKESVVISAKDSNQEESTPLVESQLKRTAALFIERFGSYSNQSNFSNISDLKIYMSEGMKVWADDFVQKNNVDRDVSTYYGITTKAISQDVEFIDESAGNVSILVTSLRRETGGDLSEDNSFYQEALVRFVLEKGFWKVSSANWQ
ncbi:hypothetical protein C0584_01450 [Candidatus Parcubacteria bacterium]|nr:MAG: hypothetical protein C0584_01450 [Candidatus Parcubacteria bacterium]